MRSSIARKVLEDMPAEDRLFNRRHAAIVVRIHQLMKKNNMTQKELATSLGKAPSEISKWLKGEHNFTLRSLCKLEAALGESLLEIPQEKVFTSSKGTSLKVTVNTPAPTKVPQHFEEYTRESFEGKTSVKYG